MNVWCFRCVVPGLSCIVWCVCAGGTAALRSPPTVVDLTGPSDSPSPSPSPSQPASVAPSAVSQAVLAAPSPSQPASITPSAVSQAVLAAQHAHAAALLHHTASEWPLPLSCVPVVGVARD